MKLDLEFESEQLSDVAKRAWKAAQMSIEQVAEEEGLSKKQVQILLQAQMAKIIYHDLKTDNKVYEKKNEFGYLEKIRRNKIKMNEMIRIYDYNSEIFKHGDFDAISKKVDDKRNIISDELKEKEQKNQK